jgi:hypothetical protein
MKVQLCFWMMAAVGASALAMGCSSTDKTEDSVSYLFADRAAFCRGVAKAVCSQTFTENCDVNADTCVANLQKWACQIYPEKYRPAEGEACITAWTAAYSNAELTGTEQAAIDTACKMVVGGWKGTGEACTALSECNLDQKLECVKGTCQVKKTVGKADDCAAMDTVCGPDLYCSPNDHICGNAPDVGGQCDDNKVCKTGLNCRKAPGDPTGTCEAKYAVNEPCTQNLDCQSGLCVGVEGDADAGVTSKCKNSDSFNEYTPLCKQAKTP